MVHYQVGLKSRAGYLILFDGHYGTLEHAREIRDSFGPGHFIWKITTEEVN